MSLPIPTKDETYFKVITPETRSRPPLALPPKMSSARPRKVEKAIRNRKIVQKRKEGWTYDQLAEEFNLSRGACCFIVQRFLGELRERTLETADELRVMEGMRLDAMQQSLWEKAMKGNEGAINTCLKILERRAKLFGMDLDKNGVMINNNNGPITKIVVEKVKSGIQDESETIEANATLSEPEQISSELPKEEE